jgi:hypothetical protein
MLHIAGASLSCPKHYNNPKSQHSARAKKVRRPNFLKQLEPPPLADADARTIRFALRSAATEKILHREFGGPNLSRAGA